MKNIFVAVIVLLFFTGCNCNSHISPEIVCGEWQLYGAESGRNGKEQKQLVIYTFMPDGNYVCRITETAQEETTGKWEIKDGKLLLSDAKNNTVAYTYSKAQGHTFIHTAYEKIFFPKGFTFILRKK